MQRGLAVPGTFMGLLTSASPPNASAPAAQKAALRPAAAKTASPAMASRASASGAASGPGDYVFERCGKKAFRRLKGASGDGELFVGWSSKPSARGMAVAKFPGGCSWESDLPFTGLKARARAPPAAGLSPPLKRLAGNSRTPEVLRDVVDALHEVSQKRGLSVQGIMSCANDFAAKVAAEAEDSCAETVPASDSFSDSLEQVLRSPRIGTHAHVNNS